MTDAGPAEGKGEPPTLRSVGFLIYLPSLLFGIGEGALMSIIALSARERGASVAVAALAVAALGLGKLVGDLPAGQLAARVGERRAMLVAAALAVPALLLCVVASPVWALCLALGVVGVASAVWGLARQAYLTDVMPYRLRGRALSTLGGMQRVGLVVGPALAALAMGPLGIAGGYWVHVLAALLAAGVLLVARDPVAGRTGSAPAHQRLGPVVRRHLPVFRTIGLGSLTINAVRTSRQVVLPLWAVHVGIGPAQTSLLIALSGAMEVLMFYPGGLALDRLGRRWVVTLTMGGLGAALVLIPLATTPLTVGAVAVAMGLANGLGSGINMTIGADLSPAAGRPVFLGAWRLCTDIGNGLGPVAIGGLTAAFTLAPAAVVMGGAAGACAVLMNRWLAPERRPRPDSNR